MRSATRYLIKTKGLKKVGILYQDDDFGLEVLRGAEAGAKDMGQALCEKTTYKRGATDFSSQIQRLQSAGCDFVVLGTIMRETIGAIATARKLGWNVGVPRQFRGLRQQHPEARRGGGGRLLCHLRAPELPDYATANARLKQWIDDYKKHFNEDPTVFSTAGYTIIDVFVRAAEKAGPNLNPDDAQHGAGEHDGAARFLRRAGVRVLQDQPPRLQARQDEPDPERQVGDGHGLPGLS